MSTLQSGGPEVRAVIAERLKRRLSPHQSFIIRLCLYIHLSYFFTLTITLIKIAVDNAL